VPFPGSTSRGAVTALKLLAHDTGKRLCVAANEGGDVVVWQRELPARFVPVFAASLCKTTPRCILDDGSPKCLCVAVVEEGRRVVVVDIASSPGTVREQFVSVSRLRGAARIAGSVVVAGQGLQVL
jgi:hypothetical protein